MADELAQPSQPDPGAGVGVAGAGALGGVASLDPPASEEPLPRQFGKYTLLRKLAKGGMAELFLALHRSVAGFEKLVVIKRILPQMNQDRQFIDMLLHEARIAATLSHPNIVQTFDVGQVDGTYFIAMEHIHGEDIRTVVRQMKQKNVNELPLEHALHIVIGLCAGLSYAHEKRDMGGKLLGIVHRDISPQNIVITFSGDVKVVDFGVAKSLHVTEDSKGGHLKGKVPYMSPEQAAGEDIDWRSDIFAAGVILFELTTGKRLFKGASEYDTLKLICESEYPLPSDVAQGYPVGLERIVMKALAKNRDGRYQTAREMQADLEAFVRQERVPVSPVSVSAWMEKLFAEILAQQVEAMHDIKALADRIAAENPPPPDYAPASTGSHPRAFDQSHTGGVLPAAATSIAPPSKRSGAVVAGLLAVAVAVGAGAFFLWKSGQDKPAEAGPAATAAPPSRPEEPRASLRLESDPPGAAIWINGDLRKEVTPATIDSLPVGQEIRLKLSMEGFESHKEGVTLERAGDTKAVTVKLQTGSVTVELDVLPEPTVWVDEKPWKGDPKKITVSADEEHKIVVAASGYVPKTFTFTGKQGETKKFKHIMPKQSDAPPPDKKDEPPAQTGGTGSVRVNARGSHCVNVTINGAGFGPTPVVATVAAGTVRVTCKREDGTSQSQAAKLDPGGTARVSF